MVERTRVSLDQERFNNVMQREPTIRFGTEEGWPDIEADEVDLAKNVLPDGQGAIWEQWCGVVQRGDPSSLVLFIGVLPTESYHHTDKISRSGPNHIS